MRSTSASPDRCAAAALLPGSARGGTAGLRVFPTRWDSSPATIAMFGAALLLLLDTLRHHPDVHGEKVHSAFTRSSG